MSEIYYKPTTDAWREGVDNGTFEFPATSPVNEQHPLPIKLQWMDEGEDEWDGIDASHPLPVAVQNEVVTQNKLWVSPWVEIPFGATSGALDANDALGDKFYFTQSIEGVPLPVKGRIKNMKIIDRDDDTLADTIHIFNAEFTAAASDAAFTISVADSRFWVASKAWGTYIDLGSAKVVHLTEQNIDYYAPSGMLVCQESTTGTPTIASGAMPLVQLTIEPLD